MTRAVLDASVVLKWFRTAAEPYTEEARSLRADFQSGRLRVVGPSLLMLEVINVACRRWKLRRAHLLEVAAALSVLPFEVREPDLENVAEWSARGLTAYDASYVALAECEGIALVTDDRTILAVAPDVAVALSTIRR